MKILAIGAHFDDVEIGCGGSLLRWRQEDHNVVVFVATSSGYSSPANKEIRSDEAARKEGLAASKEMGAELIEGNFQTFKLEFNEALNSQLRNMVEKVQPDLVLSHWSGDSHHDHRSLALSTLHCCRHIPRILLYCSNWYENDKSFHPKLFVDITNTFNEKIKLIEKYKSEHTRTQGKWTEFLKSQAVLTGLKAGVKYAEGFMVVKWLY